MLPVFPETVDASREFLGQPNDNALGAADVGEPIRVLVLHDLAYQFGAMGKQVRDDVVDVVDGEHDAAHSELVHRRVLRTSSYRFRRVELVQLDQSVAVRCAQKREGSADILKPNESIYGGTLDGRLTHQLESEFEKEGLHGFEVVDDDEDVIQSLDSHVSSIAEAVRGDPGRPFSELDVVSRGSEGTQGDEGAAKLPSCKKAIWVSARCS